MPPTLASLVQHSALKLTVRAGADRLDDPVRWAHASELADPVPYMEGGELLLVTATQPGRRGRRGHAPLRAAAGRCGGRRARLRGRRQLRGHPGGARRRRRGRRAAAPRSAAPHAVPRHQQGRVGGHRRRPVPRGHRRIRGPARADTAAPLGDGPAGLLAALAATSTAGPRCTTPRAPSSPPHPTGPRAGRPGSPATWNGCGSGPRPRARWWRAGTTERGPRRTAVAGHRAPGTRRARRRYGRRAGHRGAVRRALRRRPAHPDHGALALLPGRRAAARRGRPADAAVGPARPCARGRRRPVRRAARRPLPAADRGGGRARRFRPAHGDDGGRRGPLRRGAAHGPPRANASSSWRPTEAPRRRVRGLRRRPRTTAPPRRRTEVQRRRRGRRRTARRRPTRRAWSSGCPHRPDR